MSGKKLLLAGLVVVMVLGSLLAVGCGGKDDAKVAVQAALDKVEVQINGLMGSITQATGASLQEAMDGSKADWDALVLAIKDYEAESKFAKAADAQKLWDDMFAAIDGLAADAGVADILPVVGEPGGALKGFVDQLRLEVGASPTTEAPAGEATTVAPAADDTTTTVAAQ